MIPNVAEHCSLSCRWAGRSRAESCRKHQRWTLERRLGSRQVTHAGQTQGFVATLLQCGFLHFLFTRISHLLQVNFVSYVQMAAAALPVLETSGGSIIVVSSVAGESLTLLEHVQLILIWIRAVRYDDIYRMDEIKSLSFHIMFYRLFRGVAKYIVSGNTFWSFEWLRSLYAAHHGTWRRDRTTSQDTTSSLLNEGLHLYMVTRF